MDQMCTAVIARSPEHWHRDWKNATVTDCASDDCHCNRDGEAVAMQCQWVPWPRQTVTDSESQTEYYPQPGAALG